MLKKKCGQSMVEFAIILPVFLLLVLGIVQASLVFVNVILLKYVAFMTARCAVSYQEPQERDRQTAKARVLMLDMLGVVNGGGNIIKAANAVLANRIVGSLDDKGLIIERTSIAESKAYYLKVTVGYDMPLEVPVVNKVFGMFNGEIKYKIFALAKHPVYRLTATAFMRTDYGPQIVTN